MKKDEIIPYTLDMPMYMMPRQISGLRTGYYELNKRLSGWQRSQYVIVGYDDPEDANEFISNNVSASNSVGSKIAIISLNKAISYSIVDYKKSVRLHDYNSIFDLRKKEILLLIKNGIEALIIDDFTKISVPYIKCRSKKDTYRSQSLRRFSREQNITVISLVPVNTNNEIPQLSLFKNTTYNLVQEADVVIFLTRGDGNKLTPLVALNHGGSISDIYRQSRDTPKL